jgi:nitroreductase
MTESSLMPLTDYVVYPEVEMQSRAAEFYQEMCRRRSVRSFSNRELPANLIEDCIKAAGTAPNGANKQPWHFVVVRKMAVKKRIRDAAEAEERKFYAGKAGDEWLADLKNFNTDANKPFLETAPVLIIIFARSYDIEPTGKKKKNYYVQESVGIATGILITGLHHAGLVTLTHTPSPMGFLNEILNRPKNERPFLILVTGYPADNTKVPKISKKKLNEIATFI